uniref:Uncharacterized protein n=1 Tax=Tanacetum cinerariifolium TaxID=118510 RepID=A0A699IAB6_TANCI|nr:hypothetical protein [Tanacetum cinerariifolium]
MRRVRKGFSRRVTSLFLTMVIQSELGEGLAMPTDPHHTPTILQSSSSQPQKTYKPRKPTRKVTQVPHPSDLIEHVTDEAVHKMLGDSLVRAATTASSLEAEQESGGGPRCQEAMEDTTAQTRVFDLEKTKTTQGNEIDSLKRKVKKLENNSFGEDASKQGRIKAIDMDEDITLVNDQDDAEMFVVNDLGGEEEQEEPSKSTKTTATIPKQQLQDKGKGIMIEEPVKPKKKDQIRLDEEAAKRLKAEFDEEERLAREKSQKEQEANIALIETWDDIQTKIDVEYQLVERLQAQEQEE